jgi:hypothetical protein
MYRVKKKAILPEGALKSAPFVFSGEEWRFSGCGVRRS